MTDGIWRPSSIGVRVTCLRVYSCGFVGPNMPCPPGGTTCSAIRRDAMSEEQLNRLGTLALVNGTRCYAYEMGEWCHLAVLDQDGSEITYDGPPCTAMGTIVDSVIDQAFFASFPLTGAERCSQ